MKLTFLGFKWVLFPLNKIGCRLLLYICFFSHRDSAMPKWNIICAQLTRPRCMCIVYVKTCAFAVHAIRYERETMWCEQKRKTNNEMKTKNKIQFRIGWNQSCLWFYERPSGINYLSCPCLSGHHQQREKKTDVVLSSVVGGYTSSSRCSANNRI